MTDSFSLLHRDARCAIRSGVGPELNARIYDAKGVLSGELILGDGIQDVRIDTHDRIWVSYFDEGVLGNSGWGDHDDGPDPIGETGLVCVDRRGTLLWKFAPPSGLDRIIDCYAMNVSNDATWVYYHSEFSIARVDHRAMIATGWNTPARGARALATDGERVLPFGDYGEDANRCRLLQLHETEGAVRADVELTLPKSDGIVSATGIGDQLHVFSSDGWRTFSLSELI